MINQNFLWGLMMERQMNPKDILETLYVQRSYDGRWEKLVKILDYENEYRFVNEAGNATTLIPEKWMTVAVYDWMGELVDE